MGAGVGLAAGSDGALTAAISFRPLRSAHLPGWPFHPPENIGQLQRHVARSTLEWPLSNEPSVGEIAEAVSDWWRNEGAWNRATMAALIKAEETFKSDRKEDAAKSLDAFPCAMPLGSFSGSRPQASSSLRVSNFMHERTNGRSNACQRRHGLILPPYYRARPIRNVTPCP
jgi:hypothetical protein